MDAVGRKLRAKAMNELAITFSGRGGRHKNHAAIASSRRLVTGGPKKPMTMNTAIIALAINPNTPIVP